MFNHKKILFSVLCVMATLIGATHLSKHLSPSMATTQKWQQKSLKNLTTIERILADNHPGALDKESNAFRSWMITGKSKVHKKLRRVNDKKSHNALLSWFIKGFNDSHVAISFQGPKDTVEISEWAGLIMNYEPRTKTFFLHQPLSLPVNTTESHDYRRVTKINGTPPREWLKKNNIPFQGGGILGLESAHAKTAPLALVWSGNPFAEKPRTISLKSETSCNCALAKQHKTQKVTLQWQPITQHELFTKIQSTRNPSTDETATIKFLDIKKEARTDKHACITLPTFWPTNPKATESLRNIPKQVEKAQSLKSVIFDLRGNTGGDSAYGSSILKSLYGSAYFDQETFKSTSNERVDWRATTDNIAHLQKYYDQAGDSKEYLGPIIDGMKKAQEATQPFFTEEKNATRITLYTPNPVTAKIYIIIDSSCVSAALDFIDEAKALSDVTLIGQPTSADSLYMDCRSETLPQDDISDDKTTLTFPIKVYRNRLRGHNMPYTPDIFLDSNILNNDELLLKKIRSIID